MVGGRPARPGHGGGLGVSAQAVHVLAPFRDRRGAITSGYFAEGAAWRGDRTRPARREVRPASWAEFARVGADRSVAPKGGVAATRDQRNEIAPCGRDPAGQASPPTEVGQRVGAWSTG